MRQQGYRSRAAAIAEVEKSADLPQLGREPEGEILWEDLHHDAVGYTRKILLTTDGYLWSVTHNSSDGASWGDYNCGYNTTGRRLPATDELIARIRWKPQAAA